MDGITFNRREQWVEAEVDGETWRMVRVPDWVFDYLERGEKIPFERIPFSDASPFRKE